MTAIRAAAAGDLDRITAIYADAVLNGTATYELVPPDRAEMAARYREIADRGFPYLVAEEEGHVLGYAYAAPFRSRPAYRFIVEDSIYVAPEAKGRGIGAALLDRLIVDTAGLGFRQIVAVIGDGSPQSASVRLHERGGFRHSGALAASGFKHGRWLDTVFMQLALNGGGSLPPAPDCLAERLYQVDTAGQASSSTSQ